MSKIPRKESGDEILYVYIQQIQSQEGKPRESMKPDTAKTTKYRFEVSIIDMEEIVIVMSDMR
jgi:hypothetical protein